MDTTESTAAAKPSAKTIRTDINARFLINGQTETEGTIVRLAEENVLVEDMAPVSAGSQVIFYLDSGERFEGIAKSVAGDMVSIAVKGSAGKRAKLAAMANDRANQPIGFAKTATPRAMLTGTTRRTEERTAVESAETNCILHDGREASCRVLDISLTGLAIAIDPVLTTGQIVRVGKVVAMVVRRTELGYGLQVMPSDTPLRAPQIHTGFNASTPKIASSFF